MKTIHVNQLGFRAGDLKKAVVAQDDKAFEIVAGDGTVVFRGESGEVVYDAGSAENVRVADFSEFRENGEFFLRADSGDSYHFLISENPYAGLRAALLEMFNYQKCGVALDCGLWSHPACHTTLATVYGTGEKLDVSGGWHDAGDYGRYVVPAAMAVADLLLAHELSPTPAPELLETVWFEVEWLLKMQCAKTGGVYHKVSCRTFNALDEMPHDEHGELVLSPISMTATADFAAVTALAARFYPARRGELLAAASRAWQWCMENPDAPHFVNPPEIRTGQYGDNNFRDEIFWAACELFAATGDEKFHDAIKRSEVFTGLGWADMGTYGIAAYLLHAGEKSDAKTAAAMKSKLQLVCEEILKKNRNEPYGTSQGTYYRWGSNLDVANNAQSLLLYNAVEPNADYKNAAMEHMHYLLGRNPLSRSYITGFGANAAKNPHHRPSVAVGAAYAGMLVGGPNSTTPHDTALQAHCEGEPPSKFYFDHADSFASNEIAVYWNSTAYFLAAVLDM